MRKLVIAGLLACTCLQTALAAPTTYDEATDGDLSGLIGFAFPAFLFDVGTNTIKGVFGSTPSTGLDFDNIAFFVPTGLVITSATVALSDDLGNILSSNWFLRSGTNVIGSGTAVGAWTSVSPGSSLAPGLPLGDGATYNLAHNSFSSALGSTVGDSARYTFEFVVEAISAPVPEPVTAAMLGAGLAGLALARRPKRN